MRLRYAISGLLPHGRVEEGLAEIEAMLRTDPLSLLVRWWAGIMAYLARRPERMIEEGRHMIALDPNHFLGHWTLGDRRWARSARCDEAVACAGAGATSCRAGRRSPPASCAYACGRAGRRDDARAPAGSRSRRWRRPATFPRPPSPWATSVSDDWDAALGWLDKAIDARDPIVMPIRTFPFLDPVRGDARFQALLKKMRLA